MSLSVSIFCNVLWTLISWSQLQHVLRWSALTISILLCSKDQIMDLRVKSKFSLITGHDGPGGGGSCSLESSTLSLTSTVDRSGWVTRRPSRFTLRRQTRHTLYKWLIWGEGLEAGLDWRGKSLPTAGFELLTVQPVASRYTDFEILSCCVYGPIMKFAKKDYCFKACN
jgi:hypothetical protein